MLVEKPGRYAGGEYGILAKRDAELRTVIAFPDLYEIGMSNQALRILYNRLNSMPGISCDRAFAPGPDFEGLLRQQGIPLYGLDTGLVLADADLLLFTLGYEPGAVTVLAMLDLAGVPIHARERREGDPLVVIGGPCVSNPLPYAAFADAFWIGEAEAGFFDIAAKAREIKKLGGSREEILGTFLAHPSVWALGKGKARRAVDLDFPRREPKAAVFPVPSLKAVQHHGAVEIMRGCPNGCRFCHAGYWYRPMRQKSAAAVQAEAAEFINHGGYREISLSSLSTGDYHHIAGLVDTLNREFSSRHVSFQLPSVRVSTFSLPLLEKISEVRRSGLTFAVESPEDFWQLAINKEVSLQSVIAILKEAKKNGWRGAKFYFMIGLPVSVENSGKPEEEAIVEFVLEAAGKTGMHFAINVGTFVPKPHTPFQWAPQLSEAGARKKLDYIRDRLKPRGHKVGVQDPFISVIEGLFSRGDERAGAIIEEAWKQGCRLDAWTEF
ncbi:MAG: radical SAM protein, partial [Treponema sp.]|nr:radical SAM protein [Treponema sp.]